jgi:toxin-antitoxin system PIN domain toxin
MILIDVNLLLYAHVDSYPQHRPAQEWLDTQLTGSAPVGLPSASLLAFLRLVTNPRVLSPPESVAAAWAQVEDWLNCESVWIPEPTERHVQLLGDLVRRVGAGANLIPDAHLAALAIEHGLTLCSADADFARFPDLRWLNPLTPVAPRTRR